MSRMRSAEEAGRLATGPRQRLWVAGLLLLLLAGGMAWFLRKGTRGTTELPVYTIAAERMAEGAEIYRRDDPKPFTYPPFFALPFVVFVPFGEVPIAAPRPWPPFVLWYLINVATLAALLVWVHRRVWRDAARAAGTGRPWVFWAITAALAGRHLTATLENQSHDLLVFGSVALGVEALCREKHGRAGAWLGLGAACKATPGLFGLGLLVQRRWLALAGMAAAGAAATLIPDVVLPRADDQLWATAWVETFLVGIAPGETAGTRGAWTAGSALNQSLSGTLHRLLTPVTPDPRYFVHDVALIDASPGLRKTAILGASLAVLGLLALVAWPRRRERDALTAAQRRFGEASAVVCGMVLLSPMSSKSHFCVLLMPIAFCTAHWLFRGRDRALAVFGALVFLVSTCTMKGLVGRETGGWLLAHGAVTWATVLTLLATCHVLLFARPSNDP